MYDKQGPSKSTSYEIDLYVEKQNAFKVLRCTTRVAYNGCFQLVGNKRRTECIERE